jgi:hypothetical protein
MSHAESDYLEKLIEKYLDRKSLVSVKNEQPATKHYREIKQPIAKPVMVLKFKRHKIRHTEPNVLPVIKKVEWRSP